MRQNGEGIIELQGDSDAAIVKGTYCRGIHFV